LSIDKHTTGILKVLILIVFVSVNKLPIFKSNAEMGEQQLITNHVDPVISPIFIIPDEGRELH
jgi:hypothetical protein